MKNKLKKFLILGLVATSTALVADKFIEQPSVKEYSNMLTSVIERENLDVKPNVVMDNLYVSNASLSLTQDGSKNVKINLGSITTNFLKIMAPLSALESSTRGVYDFIALHEYSHGQLNYLMQNKKEYFNITIDGFSASDMKKINDGFNNYFKVNQKAILTANLHENFADTYASVLMIRNLSEKYSDNQIKKIITHRHHQVKNQNEIMFGVFGDLEHRTDLGLNKILSTSFDEIRKMSPEEAQDFTLKVASAATVEKFSNAYKTLIKNNFDLDGNSKLAVESFKIKDVSKSMLSMKKIRDSSLTIGISKDNKNKV